ncbi:MAG: metallophosphoesterase family protein [Bacillota bacterium]
MRLAFFGDVHGNLAALDAVLSDVRRASPDAVVCLGDLVFKGPQGQACVERLAGLGIPTVQGNTDRYLLEDPPELLQALHQGGAAGDAAQRSLALVQWYRAGLDRQALDFLRRGAKKHHVDTGAGSVLVVHGSPRSDEEAILPTSSEADLAAILHDVPEPYVVFGHCHIAFARPSRGKLLIGTGSVGRPFDGDPRAAWALLDVESGSARVSLCRTAYDVDATVRAAREANLPGLEAYEQGLRAGISS